MLQPSELNIVDQVILDSKDRESTSTNSCNFTIKFPRVSGPVKWLQLVKIIIPVTYDTVNSTNNTFTIGGVLKTIPTGHYSYSALVSELNALCSGYTWSWENESRYKVVEDLSANFTLIPGLATELLGFTSGSTYTGASSYQSENFPDFTQGFDYLTLHSSELSRRSIDHVYHSDLRSNLLAIIPSNVAHSEVISWEPHFNKYYKMTDSHLNFVDFQLRNKAGNSVTLGNQSICLVFNRYA